MTVNSGPPPSGVTQSDLDAALQGVQWKDSVRVVAGGNIVLTGEQTIDGVLTSANRVLLPLQTDPTENGSYLTAAGAWVRTADADTGEELQGAVYKIEAGTVNTGKEFRNSNLSITLGVTAITFVNFTSAVNHANLFGLQGGTDPDFFHLNSTQHTDVTSLTTAEFAQLANIGTSTVSAAQWGFVGAMDQGVATTDSVTFAMLAGDGSGLTNLPGIQTAFSQIVSVTVANTTTETTILGTGVGSLLFPANTTSVGQVFQGVIHGFIQDTGNPNITIDIKLNGTVIASTGMQQLGTAGAPGIHFVIAGILTARTIGVAGTSVFAGSFETENDHFPIVNFPPSEEFTVDTTIAQTLDVTITWAVASASNTITSQIVSIAS